MICEPSFIPTPIPYPWLADVLSRLSHSWLSGRFHHGLLLQGVSGSGKWALATLLGQGMLCQDRTDLSHCGRCKCCLLEQAGNHPDIMSIDKAEQTIGIDDIRQATAFVQQKPQIAVRRVLLIKTLEKLTEPAANALLKTLEEPHQNVFIVATSDEPNRLLPTIVSRCMKQLVSATDQGAVYQWLCEQARQLGEGLSQAQFDQLFQLANHGPLQVLQWLQQQKLTQLSQLSRQFEAWRTSEVSVVQLRDLLLDNDFALALFEQHVLRLVAGQQLEAAHFEPLNRLFDQLNLFGRDAAQNTGQNKSLAMLQRLIQLDRQLCLLQL